MPETTKLERTDALMRDIVQQSFDGILSVGEDGRVATANAAALGIFGYAQDEFLGTHVARLLPGLAGVAQETWRTARAVHEESVGRRRDGAEFPVDLSLRATVVDEEFLRILIVRDITEAKKQQAELRHRALHDSLTGLPNRTLLNDRLAQALAVAGRDAAPMALLLLDLDRFKEVNDTLGHHVGDHLLREIAERLKMCVRPSDTVARLGGDEFAIVLPAATDAGLAVAIAERTVATVERPVQVLDGLRIEVGLSAGIALFPEHAADPPNLLQCADVAMYAAKSGSRSLAVYDRAKDRNSVRHLTLTGALRQAIEGGQLTLHYQPKLDLRTGAVCGVEALARWHHPRHGSIPPEEFVPHAERTGMIMPFSRWSLVTALGHLADWHGRGRAVSLAVNLSPRTLHDRALPGMIEELLRDWRIEPHQLTLELTESAVMLDPDRAQKMLHVLRGIGVTLSVDDFGTGYSSLARLRDLPVSELKIDRSFVMRMSERDQDLTIVRSIVDLAHNLDLAVVAEGIEQPGHLELLRELGCDTGQGHLISEAVPAEVLLSWLADSGQAGDVLQAMEPRRAEILDLGVLGHAERPELTSA